MDGCAQAGEVYFACLSDAARPADRFSFAYCGRELQLSLALDLAVMLHATVSRDAVTITFPLVIWSSVAATALPRE